MNITQCISSVIRGKNGTRRPILKSPASRSNQVLVPVCSLISVPVSTLTKIAFGLEPGDSRSRTGKNEIRCRYAPAGTSFSYTVKNVPVDIQLDLQVTVRGRDTVLKICCGEQEIFSEGVNLTMDEPAEKTIRLPSSAVSADGALKITFSGGDGKWSPEITRIRLLKKN